MTGQKEQTELQIFKTILMHCMVIIACPVLTFFLSKSFIFDLIFKSSVTSSVYSAGAAVLVLHLALGLYIYRAYFDSPTKVPAKTD